MLVEIIRDLNPFGASVLVCSAATAKFHTLGSFSNGNVYLQGSGGWKPKVAEPAGQVFLRPLLCVPSRGCPAICVSVCLSVT